MRPCPLLVLLLAAPASAQTALPLVGGPVPGARLPGLVLTRGLTQDEGVVLADLDADGRVDLAAVSDAELLVVLGLELTRMGTPVVSPSTAGGLRDLVARDFDGDGDLDLAGSVPLGPVQLLENVGAGHFILGSAFTGVDFAASDLDLDGDVDLATLAGNGLSVSIHRNQGSGAFVPGETVPLPGPASSVFSAQLDGPAAAPALVCGTTLASAFVLPNTGVFTLALTFSLPAAVTAQAMADFDGDSFADLWGYSTFYPDMFSPPQNQARIFLWNGAGFSNGPTGPGGTTLRGFAPGDVDGDGDLDLVLSYEGPPPTNNTAFLRVLRNDGTSLASSQHLTNLRSGARGVACADVNLDGRVEVLRARDGELALYPNVLGAINVEQGHTLPYSWQGTADLDDDGDLDGFSGIGTQLRVIRMSGSQGNVRNYAAVSTATCAASLDADLDGDLDIALGTVPLSIFPNNGSGIFTGTVSTYPSPGAPSQLEAVDLDDNGAADVLALRETAGSLEVYLNTAGVLGPATSVATGAAPSHLHAGDLDRDGDLDIVLPNRTSGTGGVALLRNNGFGGLAAPVHQAVGIDSLELDLGDLDRDGDPDVLVRLPSTLQRLDNDGSGGLSFAGAFAQTALAIKLADLDSDGRIDLLAAGSTGNLQWLRSASGPLRSHELQLAFGLGYPVRIIVRDLDGNGTQDVASIFHWLKNARH